MFFVWNQSLNIIYPNKENVFLVSNIEKEDYYANPCLSYWKTNFKSKTGKNWCFSYETKASILFIPMRRICFWCRIMKRKEDYYVNPCLSNSKMNFKSKNGKNRCFSYETKASIPFIPMRRMCFWCRITKWK